MKSSRTSSKLSLLPQGQKIQSISCCITSLCYNLVISLRKKEFTIKHWSVTTVIAVCAIASPVLVTFINLIFKSHSERIEHRLNELHNSIRDKQRALKQISKSYSVFVIEAKTGDNKALEDFFSQIEFCMSLIDEKDKLTLHNLELSVRYGVYLTHEDYFYKARDAILNSIAKDKSKIKKLTTSKFSRSL